MEISRIDINPEDQLVTDLRHLIDEARRKVAAVANAGIATMYWQISERINRDVLGNQRAAYGKRIVSTVATQLQHLYGGTEFTTRNLRRMMQLATL